VSCFIRQMNKKARQLELNNTSFANPHGLQNALNYSTAKDMLSLSIYCSSYQRFMEIVSTEIYTGSFQRNLEDEKDRVDMTWRNTNKLLTEGWEGIKTGHTNNAGACLSSSREGVFIVVLNSESSQTRFEDTVNLYNWYCSAHR
jgi:D-alanyl-D-alanine carboxypeptidase (penicillin-binding protein 5/6)